MLKSHFPINITHFQLYGIHYGWLKLPEFLNPHARKTFQDFHRSYFFKRVPGFPVTLAKVRLKKQGEPLRFRKILNGRRIAKVESKTTSHYLSKSNKKRLSASIFRARARVLWPTRCGEFLKKKNNKSSSARNSRAGYFQSRRWTVLAVVSC